MAKRVAKCGLLDKSRALHAAEVLKAVAHPVRLEIVALLQSRGEMTVNELVEAIGGKQSITSQQLNMMRRRGILSCRKDGAKVYYSVSDERIVRLLKCMCP
jgi:DNA-binding transcriptional ArsR family regulator